MNSSITIDDRQKLLISGVKSVELVTDTNVNLFTEQGDLSVRGSGLETDEFDPASGLLRIRGRIDSVSYTSEKRHLPENIITKLFR